MTGVQKLRWTLEKSVFFFLSLFAETMAVLRLPTMHYSIYHQEPKLACTLKFEARQI
jgi:hypothetical protein